MLDGVHIQMEMEVETHHVNPFDFLIEEKKNDLHDKPLAIYLHDKEKLSPEMLKWIKQIKDATGDNIITFLSTLCSQINADWDHAARYDDHLLSATECYSSKKGSCRDLSWMLIQVLRNAGIPARFVSGYANNPDLEEGHELHAWVEAWLYGSGWLGLDPTAGLFTQDQYVPVATSYLPKLTLPVQGTFRGVALSTLQTKVEIIEI